MTSATTSDAMVDLALACLVYPTQDSLAALADRGPPAPEPSTSREDAARLLGEFCSFARARTLGEMEDLYTRTFDFSTDHHPYVGYQIHGEDRHRLGRFLIRLKEEYERHGFRPDGSELPDFVVTVARFVTTLPDPGMSEELRSAFLVPALTRMGESLRRGDSPYAGPVESLRLLLGEGSREGAAHA